MVHVVLRDRAADDHPGTHRQTVEHGIEDRPADIVVDVDAVGSQLAQSGCHVLVLVVDGGIEAELVDEECAFGGAAGDADDPGTVELHDLSGDRADRARCGRDHEGLARLWFGDPADTHPRGRRSNHQRRGGATATRRSRRPCRRPRARRWRRSGPPRPPRTACPTSQPSTADSMTRPTPPARRITPRCRPAGGSPRRAASFGCRHRPRCTRRRHVAAPARVRGVRRRRPRSSRGWHAHRVGGRAGRGGWSG